MPTRAQIIDLGQGAPPPGAVPYVDGAGPLRDVHVVEPDAGWPEVYDAVRGRIVDALGWRVIVVEHVGSTAVADLPAKPVIDVNLIVADPADEPRYVPALAQAGFVLRRREPWWHEHRLLRLDDPVCNLHVHGPDSPAPVRERLFRDWLRGNADDRELYAETKRAAAGAAQAVGEHTMQYNARKQAVVREIYARAFAAAGLLD